MKMLEAIRIFCETIRLELSKSTTHGYSNNVCQFATFVHNCDLREVREKDIVEYFNLLRSSPLKQNSLMLKSQSLKKFFSYWHKRDFKVLDPEFVPLIPREFAVARVADVEDFKKILALAPPEATDNISIRNRAIMLLLFDTGMRVSELCSMDMDENFDLEKMQAIIKTKKSKGIKPIRQVMWQEETNDCLKRWIKAREAMIKKRHLTLKEKKALFVGCYNWQIGKRISNGCINIFMMKYSRWAGLEKVLNPHSLRHRLGHDLAESGCNNSIISTLLGHSSLGSSYRYTTMSGPEMKSEYHKFIQHRRK